MIGDVGMMEILVIMVIALLLFGADRIPTLARGLGKGIRDFKKIVNNAQEEIQRVVDFEEPPPPQRPIAPPPLESEPNTPSEAGKTVPPPSSTTSDAEKAIPKQADAEKATSKQTDTEKDKP